MAVTGDPIARLLRMQQILGTFGHQGDLDPQMVGESLEALEQGLAALGHLLGGARWPLRECHWLLGIHTSIDRAQGHVRQAREAWRGRYDDD